MSEGKLRLAVDKSTGNNELERGGGTESNFSDLRKWKLGIEQFSFV